MRKVEVATSVVELARNGRFAEIEKLFAPQLRAVVSAETLRSAWVTEMAKNGPVTAVGAPAGEPMEPGLERLSVPVTCERGGLTVIMSVDDAGLLRGLRLAPPSLTSWTPPPYANAKKFSEREVTHGTLSLPRGWRRRRPGVVLMSGGGPFDRDGTTGPNKPLKDLAWGLASRGVAVARFDKPPYGRTMTEEYVPRAVAAVRSLRREGMGPIVLAGHSMGGKVAPRVAEAEPAVAGMVLLAADAQPMREAAVRVARHLAALNPGPDADAVLEVLVRQAANAGHPGLSAATPAEDLPFGLPGEYWLDVRGYDPVAAAARLALPMLILQGGRDYQVTAADDLPLWRAGLGHRPDVTIRIYDADDHLFFSGSGPSTPAEYGLPHHVDQAVVEDVADWVKKI
ncbi:alpha/beta fold hydrolase [Streptosporangiaceae bacterium NEAU-GS5]|nr:alpha/beta fold hydrolase [Streptosporangiaceae bacterium NEAU-GS5]